MMPVGIPLPIIFDCLVPARRDHGNAGSASRDSSVIGGICIQNGAADPTAVVKGDLVFIEFLDNFVDDPTARTANTD